MLASAAPNDPVYALTAVTRCWPCTPASAAPEWYPCVKPEVRSARLLRENPRLLGAYPSGTGLARVQAHEVLRHLAACGIDADPRDLLITNGATEAMQIALRAVARPGDTVIVESPVLRPAPDHRTPACARWKFPAYPARA